MRSIKTFGGIGGVFVKKRLSIEARKRSITPSPTPAQGTLIGWDDVKCRPIFEKRDPGTPSTEISDNGEDDDDDLLNDDDNQGEELSYESPEEDMSDEWNGNHATAGGRRRKRLKAFGGRKVEAYFPETTALTTVASKKVPIRNRAPTRDTSPSNLVYPFPSPGPVNTSICDALNSAQKPSTTLGYDVTAVEGSSTKPALVIETKYADGMILKKRRRSTVKNKFDLVVDEASAKQQPNSTTSVSAAKAFFARLDETELHVVATNHQAPQVSRQRNGRSVKQVDLDSTDLQREYADYSSASQESGVPPIPIADYAKSRSDIFRPNEMFDGFLDG